MAKRGDRGVDALDLQPADRVIGVPPTTAEALAVAVGPVDDGGHEQEGQVQEGGVVPLERVIALSAVRAGAASGQP